MAGKRVQSPITLYVDGIDFRPASIYGEGSRVTVIDLEFNEQMAVTMVEELTKRLEQDISLGSIRVRFSGKLVLQ